MVEFDKWCDTDSEYIEKNFLSVMTAREADRSAGVKFTAASIPEHYISRRRMAHALRTLKKTGAAKFIERRLPETKIIRSGDLGEIYATEWINTVCGEYYAPIKRHRWKSRRNLSMHGDDVIGIQYDSSTGILRFLKTEAKSENTLSSRTLKEARTSLDNDGELPCEDTLNFISDRLFESGNVELTEAIDNVLNSDVGVSLRNVRHLLFTFSGNAPRNLLTAYLDRYEGNVEQWVVALRVTSHGDFIKLVNDQVRANVNNP